MKCGVEHECIPKLIECQDGMIPCDRDGICGMYLLYVWIRFTLNKKFTIY